MKLYCDNKAAISISHNPVHHDRTKHVEVDRHFIKEKIEEWTIYMVYVPTSEQTADLLTKPLTRPVFEKLVDKLGMFNFFSQLEGECRNFRPDNLIKICFLKSYPEFFFIFSFKFRLVR